MQEDTRPALVGQAPAARMSSAEPFSGRAGRNLERILAPHVDPLQEAFRCLNLLPEFPGRKVEGERGDLFDLKAAREAARVLTPTLPEVVFFAGRAVAAAFGFTDFDFLKWQRGKQRRVVVIPHPSGIVQWYNDPACRDELRRLMLTELDRG